MSTVIVFALRHVSFLMFSAAPVSFCRAQFTKKFFSYLPPSFIHLFTFLIFLSPCKRTGRAVLTEIWENPLRYNFPTYVKLYISKFLNLSMKKHQYRPLNKFVFLIIIIIKKKQINDVIKCEWFFLLPVSQDSMNALANDLNYPALRKNKNIEAFLKRCKCYNMLLFMFYACRKKTNWEILDIICLPLHKTLHTA